MSPYNPESALRESTRHEERAMWLGLTSKLAGGRPVGMANRIDRSEAHLGWPAAPNRQHQSTGQGNLLLE